MQSLQPPTPFTLDGAVEACSSHAVMHPHRASPQLTMKGHSGLYQVGHGVSPGAQDTQLPVPGLLDARLGLVRTNQFTHTHILCRLNCLCVGQALRQVAPIVAFILQERSQQQQGAHLHDEGRGPHLPDRPAL